MRDKIRDRAWDVYGRVGCKLGLYSKFADVADRYYYVRGPGLPFAHFCVIAERLEHQRDEWTKDWISGEPAAVLFFAFWKLRLRSESTATFAEADWYRGFVEVDRRRSARR